jgi:hypothetical protein
VAAVACACFGHLDRLDHELVSLLSPKASRYPANSDPSPAHRGPARANCDLQPKCRAIADTFPNDNEHGYPVAPADGEPISSPSDVHPDTAAKRDAHANTSTHSERNAHPNAQAQIAHPDRIASAFGDAALRAFAGTTAPQRAQPNAGAADGLAGANAYS